MSIKSIIQIIILIVSIIPNFFYLWGGIRWILSGGDKAKFDQAQKTLYGSLILLVPLAGVSLLVFFLIPSIDILSIALLILTNFVFIFFVILLPLSYLVGELVLYLRKYILGRVPLVRKRKNNEFDIVFCYNEEDKADVIQLADQLQKEGILPYEIEGREIYKPQSSSPSEQAKREIREALVNRSYHQYTQLSRAIFSLIEATDSTPIEAKDFQPEILWEIVLPSLGLQLETRKALFFLRQEKLSPSQREQLVEIKNARGASLILVVDFLEGLAAPHAIDSRVVWFRPEHLLEITRTDDTVAWLGRLIASEVEYFEGLIPYSSRGSAHLFYGRVYELKQLAGGTVPGGIIIGAHGSGKTSLLDQLNKQLKTQEGYVISDRYTYSTHFRPFFEKTLQSLDLAIPDELTPEAWASTLRTYRTKGKCPVLLIDEVDQLIIQDTAAGFALGREMRALQYDGYCKFYLAGTRRLHEAVQLEGGPFRNFAQEVTLKGLEKSAAFQLIQTPMERIGFTIDDLQATRIYKGTAGVPILIQEFCKYLLLHIRRGRTSPIANAAVEKIEQIPEYLDFVFRYYKYAQTGNTMAVMLIVAQLGQANRLDILHTLAKYDIMLTWDQLDEYLKFLTQFDVLNEFEPGYYRISSDYQRKAIEARTHNSDAFLISQLERGKKG